MTGIPRPELAVKRVCSLFQIDWRVLDGWGCVNQHWLDTDSLCHDLQKKRELSLIQERKAKDRLFGGNSS
jgi:hypothetical protein